MLANTMREVATTLRPTEVAVAPARHASVALAIALIEESEGLSDDEFGDAALCITTNPTIAAVYVSMTNRSARSRYIRKQVDSYRSLEAP